MPKIMETLKLTLIYNDDREVSDSLLLPSTPDFAMVTIVGRRAEEPEEVIFFGAAEQAIAFVACRTLMENGARVIGSDRWLRWSQLDKIVDSPKYTLAPGCGISKSK